MWILAMACTVSTPGDSTDPASGTPPVATEIPSPTPTADTGDVEPEVEVHRPEVQDCGHPLPALPTTATRLNGFGPHEDFGFDAHGNVVGAFGENLVQRNRQGQTTLLAPQVSENPKGTRHLPDGSVMMAAYDESELHHVLPDGQRVVLASVANPNGLAIDIFGNTWVASSTGAIIRVDQEGEQLLVDSSLFSLDGIAFSPDYRRLYVNTEFGQVHVLHLDDHGEPVGTPELFANIPTGFSILDGMTADSCGNLYVARMDGQIFRVRPDGVRDGVINLTSMVGLAVTPALNFGSGVGGFERDHLYVMNFLGGLFEVDIGIDGRWDPHYPIPE